MNNTPARIWKHATQLEKKLTKVKSHDRKINGKKVHVKSYYRRK